MSALGLRILAVDDERPALEDLQRLLSSSPRVGEVLCASSGGDALQLLSERPFDALFLDVRMPDLDGLRLASIIAQFAHPPAVVFVSAYEEGAVGAFELQALDYLMKPVSRHRIDEALERVLNASERRDAEEPALEHSEEIVAVERAHGGATRLVQRSSILYLQAHGDYVRIVSEDGRYLARGRLSAVERRWQPHGFHRVHRGYVANLRKAVEVRPTLNGTATIVFADGSEIPVARRQIGELRRRLGM
ncbi:MAG: LytR/AlgR family response regulator transcription factor [Solirubrobacteraceae bacterium]